MSASDSARMVTNVVRLIAANLSELSENPAALPSNANIAHICPLYICTPRTPAPPEVTKAASSPWPYKLTLTLSSITNLTQNTKPTAPLKLWPNGAIQIRLLLLLLLLTSTPTATISIDPIIPNLNPNQEQVVKVIWQKVASQCA